MKKNIILIFVIVLNFIIIGFIIYQNNYINTKFKEIDEKLETIYSSNNQQDIQINQITEKQRKMEQQENLKKSETESDESTFENTPVDGLTAITEDEAKRVWDDYLINPLSKNINDYDVSEIKLTTVNPNNRFTANGDPFRIADFERSTYMFKYKQKDNLGEIVGYVDIYTGKVIGGEYKGN